MGSKKETNAKYLFASLHGNIEDKMISFLSVRTPQ
jgi:hypothetical protein